MVQQHGTSRSEPLQFGFLSGSLLESALGRSPLVVDHLLMMFFQVPLLHDVELVLS
jgi:hypothetical protein